MKDKEIQLRRKIITAAQKIEPINLKIFADPDIELNFWKVETKLNQLVAIVNDLHSRLEEIDSVKLDHLNKEGEGK